jgi:DNA-directed RNA polymerase alpha subunit
MRNEPLRGLTTVWSPDSEATVLEGQAEQTRRLSQLEKSTRSLFPNREDPIDVLGLSEPVVGTLRSSNIYTVGQLTGRTQDELLQLDNFGKRQLKEVKNLLAEHYLTLRE